MCSRQEDRGLGRRGFGLPAAMVRLCDGTMQPVCCPLLVEEVPRENFTLDCLIIGAERASALSQIIRCYDHRTPVKFRCRFSRLF